jgi:hypothetical protein
VATIAGGYNSPARMAAAMGIDAYRDALCAALERYDEYLPAIAPGGGGLPAPQAHPSASPDLIIPPAGSGPNESGNAMILSSSGGACA